MKKVFCWGTFDILHEGHKDFLNDAKSRGDHLSVIVVSDNLVYKNKGKYPSNNQKQRVEVIKRLKIADEVIAVSDDNNKNFSLISSLKPDIFVFGYDQQTEIEEKLKKFLKEKGLATEFYISKEFAGGIHSSKPESDR